ncbi:Gag-Pol polyprotein [Dictyocoela muelleri]|nr:Gag-Pol polyprotein [Dictyocoela muelleri]KAG0440576.1 Gag-Pol polyprotein [Dictyocoela muelleri]
MEGSDIFTAIQKIENSLRMSYHSSLKFSPYEFIYSKSFFDPLKRKLEINRDNIHLKQLEFSKKQQEKLNKSIITHEFEIGDSVWVKNLIKLKMDNIWSGHYLIIDKKSNGNSFMLEIGETRR